MRVAKSVFMFLVFTAMAIRLTVLEGTLARTGADLNVATQVLAAHSDVLTKLIADSEAADISPPKSGCVL